MGWDAHGAFLLSTLFIILLSRLMICFMDGWDSMTRDSSHENDDCEVYQRNIRQTHFGQP
jgi:hypothetical protein